MPVNNGWDRMAHGGGRVGRIVLCAHWEGEAMVVGNHLGRRWILLLDTAADLREPSFASGFSWLLCIDRSAVFC